MRRGQEGNWLAARLRSAALTSPAERMSRASTGLRAQARGLARFAAREARRRMQKCASRGNAIRACGERKKRVEWAGQTQRRQAGRELLSSAVQDQLRARRVDRRIREMAQGADLLRAEEVLRVHALIRAEAQLLQ